MPPRSLLTSRRLAGVVGVAVLGVLVWRAGPAQVWAALRTLSLPALLVTVALNVPITLARNLRTRLVLRRLGHDVGWWSLTRTQLAGQTLSNLTPAASGDLVRAWMWRRDDGVPAATGVGAIVYERVLSLVLLLGAGAAFFAPTIAGPAATVAICLGAAAVVATPLLLARIAPARHVAGRLLTAAGRLPLLRTRTEPLRRMGEAVGSLAADPALLATFTATTLAVFVLSGLQIWLLAAGLSSVTTTPTLAAATGIYGISQAGGSLSALPFGIGPSDAIVVGLLLRTGVPFGLGTTVALLLRATVTLPIALAAAAAVSAAGRRITGQDPADEPLITWRQATAPRPAAAAPKDREVPAWP